MSDEMTPSRALARLRQLALEEQSAVARNDVKALCRIIDLLPSTMARLEGVVLPKSDETRRTLDEIAKAHAAANEFLTANMHACSVKFRQIAVARKIMHGKQTYKKIQGARLDKCG